MTSSSGASSMVRSTIGKVASASRTAVLACALGTDSTACTPFAETTVPMRARSAGETGAERLMVTCLSGRTLRASSRRSPS